MSRERTGRRAGYGAPMLARLSNLQALLLLAVALACAVALSAAVGAFSFAPGRMIQYLGQGLHWLPSTAGDALERNVFLQLRMPRVLVAGLTGAVLGVSGTLMQGLFRNPIVEPGLVGTSAGAALGASVVFVFGGTAAFASTAFLGALLLPVCAFAGAFAATMAVYRVSASFGKVNVFTLLLAGIAVNAMCAAGTGFLSFIARDPQARNITFWSLGTFTTATWRGAAMIGAVLAAGMWLTRHAGKSLNALMLGEEEAAALGVDPRELVVRLLVVNTLMVAAATAMVGVIAFVGLVVPHLLRLARSSDYTFLVPASALLGALMMEVVDVVARLLVAPAELPVGIITALVGAPVFLVILLRQQGPRGQRGAG